MDGAALVRRYYDALDAHEYEVLEALLDPAFVQRRPDRTFEGREAFVRFMREGRPNPDTRHELVGIAADEERGRVAAHGRVLDGDRELFAFADVFELAFGEGTTEDDPDDASGRIVRLDTYAR